MTPAIVMFLIGVLCGSAMTFIGLGLALIRRDRYELPLIEQRRRAWTVRETDRRAWRKV